MVMFFFPFNQMEIQSDVVETIYLQYFCLFLLLSYLISFKATVFFLYIARDGKLSTWKVFFSGNASGKL